MNTTENKPKKSILGKVIIVVIIFAALAVADHFTTHYISGGTKANSAESTAIASPEISDDSATTK